MVKSRHAATFGYGLSRLLQVPKDCVAGRIVVFGGGRHIQPIGDISDASTRNLIEFQHFSRSLTG
jgi:hypothetical protein